MRSGHKGPRHSHDGLRHDRHGDELEAVQEPGAERAVGEASRSIGEEHHEDCGRQGEAGPGRKAAQKPAAQEADAKARLARRRPRQELRERDKIREALFGEPMAALNELSAKIAEMRDRAAKRCETEPKENAKDLAEIAGRRRSVFPPTRPRNERSSSSAGFLNALLGASPCGLAESSSIS